MKVTRFYGLALGALAVACLLGAQAAQATDLIRLLDSSGAWVEPDPNEDETDPASPTHTDADDYSNAGLDLGNDGYMFFNFGQTTPTSSSFNDPDTITQNIVNALPSWLTVDFDPLSAGYSFGDDPGEEAFVAGGVAGWANLTLPDGTTGPSGALIDPRAENNSDNIFKEAVLGAGAPSAFIMHIVTDNTNQGFDPQGRVRAREDVGGESFRASNLTFNGEPDVYSFLYIGALPGDAIKLQVNSGVPGEDASIAGIMFDIVPEPTSAALWLLGGIGLIGRRRRR